MQLKEQQRQRPKNGNIKWSRSQSSRNYANKDMRQHVKDSANTFFAHHFLEHCNQKSKEILFTAFHAGKKNPGTTRGGKSGGHIGTTNNEPS